MPVEIRELVIQAKVREDADVENATAVQRQSDGGQGDVESQEDWPSPEVMDIIVERCVARMKEWFTEKSMR